MTIMLKPKDFRHNYTCVYFDSAEGGWSTRGLRRIDTNYHGRLLQCEANTWCVLFTLYRRYVLRFCSLPSDGQLSVLFRRVFLCNDDDAMRDSGRAVAYGNYVHLDDMLHLLAFHGSCAKEPIGRSSSTNLLILCVHDSCGTSCDACRTAGKRKVTLKIP
ncbi:hypothetical protein COOONC_25998 [Cooperia oncophora]